MKAKDLDKLFDSGEVDITPYLDLSKAERPGYRPQRVNIDFPHWLLEKIDHAAKRLNVPRQSLIKVWIAERLNEAWQPETHTARALASLEDFKAGRVKRGTADSLFKELGIKKRRGRFAPTSL